MTATHTHTLTHDDQPYLSDEMRTYEGYGAHPSRPAPKYARNLLAWERAAEKIVNSSGASYPQWQGKQFGAATKIYKATVAKYGNSQPGPDVPFGS